MRDRDYLDEQDLKCMPGGIAKILPCNFATFTRKRGGM